MKTAILLLLTLGWMVLLTACGNHQGVSETAVPTTQPTTTASTVSPETVQPTAAPVSTETLTEEAVPTEPPQEEQSLTLQMTIGNTPVSVEWEDNEAVQSLKEFCRQQPLTISMSMYGGFEQVGSIGTNLPSNDVQTTTSAGDIVLYAGNQMVVFYGSNTWAYTRLGHITDKTNEELTQLLSNGNVTIALTI